MNETDEFLAGLEVGMIGEVSEAVALLKAVIPSLECAKDACKDFAVDCDNQLEAKASEARDACAEFTVMIDRINKLGKYA